MDDDKTGQTHPTRDRGAFYRLGLADSSRLSITADYYCPVSRTTGIAGRLPNTIFTLIPRTIVAILCRADVSVVSQLSLRVLCKKMHLSMSEFGADRTVYTDAWVIPGGGTRVAVVSLFGGRVFGEGQITGPSRLLYPHLFRLPPVDQVCVAFGGIWAHTSAGLYAWGYNLTGQLGLGTSAWMVATPTRLAASWADVVPLGLFTLLRAAGESGWSRAGWCIEDRVGVTSPNSMPDSDGVIRWWSDGETLFGWTGAALLACGDNTAGQCGVWTGVSQLRRLTRVSLPPDVERRVDYVRCDQTASYIVANRRCFVCSLESRHRPQAAPVELPIAVDGVVVGDGTAVFSTPQGLLISTNTQPRLIPLAPPPFTRVAILCGRVCVRRSDGSWIGFGRRRVGLFRVFRWGTWKSVTLTASVFLNALTDDRAVMNV